MRQFYLTYADDEICYTLCSKLTWSHNRLIMRVADRAARQYYLSEALSQGWSVRQTEREIQTFSYQRRLSSESSVKGSSQASLNVKQFVKDPYNPTIGILMCSEKDETVVKYSVLNGSEQIFASRYLPYLPTEEELRQELESSGRFLLPEKDPD